MIARLFKRKIAPIDANLEAQIKALDLDHVEALGEALLDFSTVQDLIPNPIVKTHLQSIMSFPRRR